jgi:hypothetical protein
MHFCGAFFFEVWIDPHFEEKHADSINDDLILEILVNNFGIIIKPQVQSRSEFKFYELDAILYDKKYRLIIVVPPDNKFIGVRNAYRTK